MGNSFSVLKKKEEQGNCLALTAVPHHLAMQRHCVDRLGHYECLTTVALLGQKDGSGMVLCIDVLCSHHPDSHACFC